MKFKDEDVEKTILAYFAKDTRLFRVFPEDIWTVEALRKVYQAMRVFYAKYRTMPTGEVLIREAIDPGILTTFQEVEVLASALDIGKFPYYLTEFYDLYAARKCYEAAERVANSPDGVKGSDVARQIVASLSAVTSEGGGVGTEWRGYAWERYRDRWEEYRAVERGDTSVIATPLGISFLDDVLNGGVRRGHIILFYGAKGAGKSRTLMNLAYNLARFERCELMYFTKEMSHVEIERCIDSRDALLEGEKILRGTLGMQRVAYFESLRTQRDRKDPFYLIDIPRQCSTLDIVAELHLYYATHGRFPEGLVIDYGNLFSPIRKYEHTHERFNFLFEEWHEVARTYNIWILTAVQASEAGDIALSRHIRDHVEVVIHLAQESYQSVENCIMFTVENNRYGRDNVQARIFANLSLNYIGDRKLRFHSDSYPPESPSPVPSAHGGGTP